VTVAQAARIIAKAAIYREWCAALPEEISPALKRRLERLYGFLTSVRLQVRVLPNKVFGLIHGKAGVILRADGRPIAFMGSTNESRSAWALNYEIVWADEARRVFAGCRRSLRHYGSISKPSTWLRQGFRM
jgi:hypothetical protein